MDIIDKIDTYLTEGNSKIFEEGYAVGEEGGSSKQNPYKRGSSQYREWIKGFFAGESDRESREE